MRRRATERRRGDEALRPRRARRQAFLLTPPAALIAHLGSLLTLTISRLRVDSGIKVGQLLTHTRADRTRALMLHAILTDMAKALRPLHGVVELGIFDFSHRPSAPDSAGTDYGCNEWGKSKPRVDSPW